MIFLSSVIHYLITRQMTENCVRFPLQGCELHTETIIDDELFFNPARRHFYCCYNCSLPRQWPFVSLHVSSTLHAAVMLVQTTLITVYLHSASDLLHSRS